jgi:hypothetical protein
MVMAELQKKQIDAIIIPATLPPKLIQDGFPEYGHVVTLLETEECFIICDPAYFILTPIVVKKTGEPVIIDVKVFNSQWSLRYDELNKKINVITNGTNLFFYKICVIENPSLAISYPINITNKRLSIVKYSYKDNQKIAHLSIRLDTQKIEGYNIIKNDWYDAFDWATCLNPELSTEQQIQALSDWDGLSHTQCNDLNFLKSSPSSFKTAHISGELNKKICNCNKDKLVKMIYSIIKTEWENKSKLKILG